MLLIYLPDDTNCVHSAQGMHGVSITDDIDNNLKDSSNVTDIFAQSKVNPSVPTHCETSTFLHWIASQ